MTKAQMAERIAELEKEVDALKAGASVETHIHYHYPQPVQTPAEPYFPWYGKYPHFTYTTSGEANIASGGGIDWGQTL